MELRKSLMAFARRCTLYWFSELRNTGFFGLQMMHDGTLAQLRWHEPAIPPAMSLAAAEQQGVAKKIFPHFLEAKHLLHPF